MTTERWALVPVEATPEMYERGRDAVTAREVSGPSWSVAQHYEASGNSTAGIPADLLKCAGKMPKGDCAEMVYAAMIHESPGAALLAEVLAARDAYLSAVKDGGMSSESYKNRSDTHFALFAALDKITPWPHEEADKLGSAAEGAS